MATIYEVLGLTAGADSGQVKAAFHALAKSSHPDLNTNDVTAEKRFKDINAAYEILSDPKKRAAYDLGLKHKTTETHRRVWKVMATTAISFMITVGCGLYFLPSAPSAHEARATIKAANAFTPSPAAPDVGAERGLEIKVRAKGTEQAGQGNVPAAHGFFTLAAEAGLKLSLQALAASYDPTQPEGAPVARSSQNAAKPE
jgi:curved DNA-binding protein CbpA